MADKVAVVPEITGILKQLKPKFGNVLTRMLTINLTAPKVAEEIVKVEDIQYNDHIELYVISGTGDYAKEYEFNTGTEKVKIKGTCFTTPDTADFTKVFYLDQPIVAYHKARIYFLLLPNDVLAALKDKSEFVKIYTSVLDKTYSEVYANMQEDKSRRRRDAFIKVRQSVESKRGEELARNIEQINREIGQLDQKRREIYRTASNYQTELDAFNKYGADVINKKVEEEFAMMFRLMENKVITDFDIVGGKLKVTTPDIFCYHNDTKYDFGPFAIVIDINRNGDQLPVNITSMKYPTGLNGYHHPHVNGRGEPCWGNMQGHLSKLWGVKDFVTMITILVEYLGSYNSGNPFKDISNWPVSTVISEEDKDKFVDCLKTSDYKKCISCEVTLCPFNQYAYLRCYDSQTREQHKENCMSDCVVEMCPFRKDLSDCYRKVVVNRKFEECIRCRAECPYAGNKDSCYASHCGSYCKECSITECAYGQTERGEVRR